MRFFCSLSFLDPHSPSEWTKWGAWSSCSNSCGIGRETRRRKCISRNNLVTWDSEDSECPGTSKETKFCRSPNCLGGHYIGDYIKNLIHTIPKIMFIYIGKVAEVGSLSASKKCPQYIYVAFFLYTYLPFAKKERIATRNENLFQETKICYKKQWKLATTA